MVGESTVAMTGLPRRIVLIGPSGSGKSSVARLVAERVGYQVVDTDERIVERIGMPISEFFERFGEAAFRAVESEVLEAACAAPSTVVATGGGIVLAPENWTTMRPNTAIVALSASPATLIERVRVQAERSGEEAVRPLLAGDAEARMTRMLEERGPLYRQADAVIETGGIDAGEVATQVEDAACRSVTERRVPALSMTTPLERSDLYVGAGGREAVPQLIAQRWPRARTVWLITDHNVAENWQGPVAALLGDAGFNVHVLSIEPGEASKSIDEVDRLTAQMIAGGVTRRDVVVALGGGVVGDLAGLVAALCLRGLPLVQLPTSLLAMVDSSVGGKTAVNSSGAKNMVGAFYQPGVVVVDPDFLATLPSRQYRCGMAEVIKHAHIQPSTPLGGDSLMATLMESSRIDQLDSDLIERALLLNVSIKHSVVQADERESGLRMILNFGHTAGHAIEADGYRYLHGEAVALGMLVASELAAMLGRVDGDYINRLEGMLERAGLPTQFDGDSDRVIANMAHDKKNVDGSVQWVLPLRTGGVETVSGISVPDVAWALEIVSGARAPSRQG